MSTAWLLVGAATDTSITARGEVTSGASVRLAISTASGMTGPVYSAAAAPDANGIVSLSKGGLSAGTRYYAALEIDGTIDTAWTATFRTDEASAGEAASFTCAFFSCAPGSGNPVSASPVHDAIGARRCDMVFHLGDFGYPNIATDDAALFRASWKEQITAAHPKLAWTSGAFHYIPDDHDWGANDSNRTSPSKDAAAATYRQCFPHPPLAEASGSLHHAFTKGRVRFIVTDERWYRDPHTDPDTTGKTMLGADQLAWFFDELLAAKDDGLMPVWVSAQMPSYGLPGESNWGDYQTERTVIWNFLADNGITDLTVIAGDLHCMGYMVAQDFSDDGGAAINCYVSSPLDNSFGGGSDPTAPWAAYAGGSGYGGTGHYAVLDIDDQGTHIAATVDFYAVTPAGAESRAFSHSFTWGQPPLVPGIYAVRDEAGVRQRVVDGDGVQRYVVVS